MKRKIIWFAVILMTGLACQALSPDLGDEYYYDEYDSDYEEEEPYTEQQVDESRPGTTNVDIYIPNAAPGDVSHPDRPDLEGDVYLAETEHFRFHYTFNGPNAILDEDENGNDIPDLVEWIAAAFEHSWNVEINQMGWNAPPPDDGIGGNDRYDVYFMDIYDDGTAGYAEGGSDDFLVGDNPYSAAVEYDATFSYIVMDNDYEEHDEFGDDSVPLHSFINATVAHEFNHSIQYGYDGFEGTDWLWEATATWMEEQVYDAVNDADFYLEAVFKSPDSCQLAEGGSERVEDDSHWYGMWIFMEYLSERYGPETVRAIWEHAVTEEGYEAISSALVPTGDSLAEVFQGFAVALLLRDFEEGGRYPTVRLEGYLDEESEFYPEDGVSQMGVDFIEVIHSGMIELFVEGLGDFLVVGIAGGSADVYEPQEGSILIDMDVYDRVYLLVLNLDTADFADDCVSTDYEVFADAADQADNPAYSLQAGNFKKPSYEALQDFDE